MEQAAAVVGADGAASAASAMGDVVAGVGETLREALSNLTKEITADELAVGAADSSEAGAGALPPQPQWVADLVGPAQPATSTVAAAGLVLLPTLACFLFLVAVSWEDIKAHAREKAEAKKRELNMEVDPRFVVHAELPADEIMTELEKITRRYKNRAAKGLPIRGKSIRYSMSKSTSFNSSHQSRVTRSRPLGPQSPSPKASRRPHPPSGPPSPTGGATPAAGAPATGRAPADDVPATPALIGDDYDRRSISLFAEGLVTPPVGEAKQPSSLAAVFEDVKGPDRAPPNTA
uniref:Uncharacterized protein n=1 Tax=Phaeomonas parva TaxID=124430 RepID=A0A6U4HZI5_9STRA|mmetsp:Transcript_38542/g.120665  ORF Transcript_38542/g.120665 Transcript_38542/m.120665 type:complete len:291 (+) Transcript_38542:233-1105(+)|eukprot:CAMPEP_0118855164 /NCGR_PEP_ID=MMETSP1163-20130328/3098_1 /TAXON_ID=124430 /ORGANISM="Phaeomonas parva, Strain CCMP2877" /LENGTH=290 /DNA_ID=CAMNT_0006788007 /DNA_START=193 /DNA_END=1065 /DNA_ORIENTATION=+